jgi:histidine ammonia-lyase
VSTEPVTLTGADLTAVEVVAVARGGASVRLGDGVAGRMSETRAIVERKLAADDEVYGLTTGVGAKKTARIDPAANVAHNRRLVAAHRVGQGPRLADEVVRAAMCRLANGLASGRPGARPELAARIVSALNDGDVPVVRTYGSIGVADLSANGDLADALLDDFDLAAGEALALLNHNAISTGHAALVLHDAGRFVSALERAAALDLEAFAASLTPFDEEVRRARPYPGVAAAVDAVRTALDGSYLWADGAARNLQDPLSFRCIPQVLGALRDALSFAGAQLAVELNAAQGNPLVVADGRIVSVGNFDALPLAQCVDLVRIALAPALTTACERTIKLLQRPQSGLPEGLALEPGVADDGLAEFGISVQALTAEARLLAQPVSYEVVSTTQAEGVEDRMTMAPLAVRRLAEQLSLGRRIVAIELVVAAQAVDLRGREPLGAATAGLYESVRKLIPALEPGGVLTPDLEPVVELVATLT